MGTVKATKLTYVPAILMGAATLGCIFGAKRIEQTSTSKFDQCLCFT